MIRHRGAEQEQPLPVNQLYDKRASRLPTNAPRTLQPPVTQSDVEAEVAHCVGGVISPLLMNIALHGMETAAGVRYKPWRSTRGWSMPETPVLIRYADDRVPRTLKEGPM